ncbi:hypothetical protein FOA52_004487 [Chlamydomonas sp. UWO 241]|nr:hypothetical protein FOA52_004487 [Chlamydomonas sp. UWO 241]
MPATIADGIVTLQTMFLMSRRGPGGIVYGVAACTGKQQRRTEWCAARSASGGAGTTGDGRSVATRTERAAQAEEISLLGHAVLENGLVLAQLWNLLAGDGTRRQMRLVTLAASSCPEALLVISAAPLPRLKKLSVSYQPLPLDEWSVAALSSTAAAGLVELHMRSTHHMLRPCLSIGAVASFSRLTKPSLEGSTIPDLLPLRQLGQLVELSIEGSRFADLSPVGDCTQIRKLSLRGSKWPVLDLTQLRDLAQLRELNIHRHHIFGCDHYLNMEEEEEFEAFLDRKTMQLASLRGSRRAPSWSTST